MIPCRETGTSSIDLLQLGKIPPEDGDNPVFRNVDLNKKTGQWIMSKNFRNNTGRLLQGLLGNKYYEVFGTASGTRVPAPLTFSGRSTHSCELKGKVEVAKVHIFVQSDI
jgi:hypothetical protein